MPTAHCLALHRRRSLFCDYTSFAVHRRSLVCDYTSFAVHRRSLVFDYTSLAVHRRSLVCDYTRLQCTVEASFATIHGLQCTVEALFATIHGLQCIVEASFATITCCILLERPRFRAGIKKRAPEKGRSLIKLKLITEKQLDSSSNLKWQIFIISSCFG